MFQKLADGSHLLLDGLTMSGSASFVSFQKGPSETVLMKTKRIAICLCEETIEMITSAYSKKDLGLKEEDPDFFAGHVVSWDGHCVIHRNFLLPVVWINNFNAAGVTILKV